MFKSLLAAAIFAVPTWLFGQSPIVIVQGQNQVSGPVYITSTPSSNPVCKITTTSKPNGQVGSAYSDSALTTSNCASPFLVSVLSGLPPGLTINSGNGQLTGTPTAAGTFLLKVSLTDSSTPVRIAQANYTIQIANVLPPPQCQITTATEPGGQAGTQYTGNVLATANCTAPLTFTVGSGSIPPGTLMTSTNGQVVGTPTTAGTYNFVAHVVDTNGNPADSSTLSIVIASAPPPPPFQFTAPLTEPAGQVGSSYTSTPAATINGTAPVSFSSVISIPGLIFNTSTGVYSGVPTSPGSFTFSLQATDSTAPPTGPLTASSVSLNIAITQSVNGADNRWCATNEISTMPQDGPANPLVNCVRTAMADTPTGGTTINVTAGSNSSLQAAINSAVCGQTIVVPALTSPGVQAVYTGGITPTKVCPDNAWIIVETDHMAQMPPEGNRVTPAWVGVTSQTGYPVFNQPVAAGIYMPKLITNNGNVIQTSSNSHWRFIGLEITTTAGQQVQNSLVNNCLGCDHNIFDRVYIHGGNNASGRDIDTNEVGFRNDGTYAAVIDSTIEDIHCVSNAICADSYAIFGGGVQSTASGPLKIVNDFLSAAGEEYLDGGGGVGSTTQPIFDLEFRRNHLFKPLFWKTNDPSYFGTSFEVKNHIEHKNNKRALFEGNILDQTWGGQSDQFGEAMNFGSKNQSSGFNGTATAANGSGGSNNPNWAAVNGPGGATTIDGFDIRQSNNEWYVADRSSGHYYKSTNQGGSWTDITSNIPTGTGISALSIQVNPNDGSLIAGGGNTVKFWRSTNDGSSWTQLVPSGAFKANPIDTIGGCAMPLASGGNLVCGGYFSIANGNAFYSTDNGVTGTTITSYTPMPGGSIPGGATYLAINPTDGSVWEGSEAAGLWKSTDGGKDFTQVMLCINGCSASNGNIYGITFDLHGNPVISPQGGIYVGSGSGFNYTWTKTFSAGNQLRGVYADPNGNMYVGHNGTTGSRSVYISTDNGQTFTPWDTGVPTGLDSNRYTYNTNDGKIYAVFFNDASNAGTIYASPTNAPATSIITWSTGTQFQAGQVASTCAVPNHCAFKYNGATYLVQSVTDSTHIVIAPAAPPSTTALAYTAYLTGLNPNAVVSDQTIRYNYITHASRGLSLFTAASDGGDISFGTFNVTAHDNVFDDISTTWNNSTGMCCAWAATFQVLNTFGSPDNMHDIQINHNTALSFQGTLGSYGSGNFGPAFAFGSQTAQSGGVPNLKVYDNLGTAGWNGSASACNAAGASVLQHFVCYDQFPAGTQSNTYCMDHNLFATTTQGSAPNNGVTTTPPYPTASPGCPFAPTGNTFVSSFAGFGFTNLNGAVGGNYQLLSTSPGHLAASDGTDIGVNWTNLQSAIAGVY